MNHTFLRNFLIGSFGAAALLAAIIGLIWMAGAYPKTLAAILMVLMILFVGFAHAMAEAERGEIP